MAKIRFGYSDDFTAKNSGVGINTTDPQENLDVDGVVKGQDLKVTGISSQTGYEGFLRADHQIEENTQLNFGQGINASLSGEIIVGTGKTVTVTENLKEDRLGPELITNGQFLFNVDNWTANDSSNSFNNGRMRITRSGGNGRATYQIITSLVPGATYFASAIVDSIGSRGDFRIKKGSLWTNDAYLLTSGTNGQVKTLSGSFTATGTTALVGFAIDDNGRLIEVDQVTVRRVNDVEEPGTNVAGGSQIECMKVYNTFTPPSGDTNQRPSKPKPGQLYYNYDFKTIEFHDGYGWRQVDNTTRSGRGVMMGGSYETPLGWSMEYVQIPTLGNSQYFGELEWGTYTGGSFASSTRGLYSGGRGRDTYDSGPITYSTAHVDSITIASRGNSTSWGTMTPGHVHCDSCSSSTRGLVTQGYPAHTTVYYVTIATEGEYGTFGNLTLGRHSAAGCSSPTRGIFSAGSSPAVGNEIDVFTIASLGNAVEFGKLSRSRRSYTGSCSNNVRGIIMGGGFPSPALFFSDMEYITIATNGNGTDFGDLTLARKNGTATATQTRGIYAGGGNPTNHNIIDYINLTSLGDAQDFGDLTVWPERHSAQSVSDSHGGLGGF